MEKKEFDKLEQYIYIESILENLDKCINRVQILEEKEKKEEKRFKILTISIAVYVVITIIVFILMGVYL